MTLALSLVVIAVTATLFTFSSLTLWSMLHAWRDPETLRSIGFAGATGPAVMSFSLLVPARHEEAVLGETLERLLQLDHPTYEVLVIVGHDDPETTAVAERIAATNPERLRIIVDHSWPKNKPKALNAALDAVGGEVVGVFDAEDEVDLRLLRAVDATFRSEMADVVQGGVQLVTFRSNWFALRNCLEYFFWFRSRLHLQSAHRFIPLGGNTVFVRTSLLRDVGGWDEDCLAEDCELGVRLSTMGAKVAVCYDPQMVTREETPGTIKDFVKQRTRWNQGFVQVFRKGYWRALPTREQRLIARFTLTQAFAQAFVGFTIPFAIIATVALNLPSGIALLSFLPAVPTITLYTFELIGLREFCRIYYVRTRFSDYLRMTLGLPFYQLLLAFAAVRAVYREARGQRGWEKTSHTGAHRVASAAVLPIPGSAQQPMVGHDGVSV